MGSDDQHPGDEPIHHLATRADWDARTATWYRPAGLEDEGFVHASFAEQVVASAERHFHARDDLVLLTVDPTKVSAPVVVEASNDHGDFPHVHGPIDLEAVVRARPFPRDAAGGFTWWQGERRHQVAHPPTRSSEAVAELLDHFAGVGFDGAPRHRGHEHGLWFTDHVDGMVVGRPVPDWLPTPEAMASLGRLLRHAHDASRGFRARHGWYVGNPDGDVVLHHDVGLGNIVWRDGLATALVDWEFAEPGHPHVDLAEAALNVAAWVPDDRRRAAGYGMATPAESLVLAMLDGYGDGTSLAEVEVAVIAFLREELRRVVELGRHGGIEPWAELDGQGIGERLEATLRWHEDGRPDAPTPTV